MNAPFYLSLLMSDSFWATMAFVVAIGLVLRPLVRVIRSALHNNIVAISQSIKNAEQLHKQARTLHQELQKKMPQVEKEARQIVTDAERLAATRSAQQQEKIDQDNLRHRRDMATRLTRMENDALADIRRAMIAITHRAAQNLIEEKLTPQQDEKNNDRIIANLTNNLKTRTP